MNEDSMNDNMDCPVQAHIIDLIKKHQWDKVTKNLSTKKLTNDIKVHSYNFPTTILHHACTIESVPINVIQKIIEVYPEACLTEDEDGCLPIHLACYITHHSFQVIRALMIACPQSCLKRDNFGGDIPLYIILQKSDPNLELNVKNLIDSIPASCIYKEDTSVLHELCSDMLQESVVKQIIQIHPQVCCIQNTSGDMFIAYSLFSKEFEVTDYSYDCQK